MPLPSGPGDDAGADGGKRSGEGTAAAAADVDRAGSSGGADDFDGAENDDVGAAEEGGDEATAEAAAETEGETRPGAAENASEDPRPSFRSRKNGEDVEADLDSDNLDSDEEGGDTAPSSADPKSEGQTSIPSKDDDAREEARQDAPKLEEGGEECSTKEMPLEDRSGKGDGDARDEEEGPAKTAQAGGLLQKDFLLHASPAKDETGSDRKRAWVGNETATDASRAPKKFQGETEKEEGRGGSPTKEMSSGDGGKICSGKRDANRAQDKGEGEGGEEEEEAPAKAPQTEESNEISPGRDGEKNSLPPFFTKDQQEGIEGRDEKSSEERGLDRSSGGEDDDAREKSNKRVRVGNELGADTSHAPKKSRGEKDEKSSEGGGADCSGGDDDARVELTIEACTGDALAASQDSKMALEEQEEEDVGGPTKKMSSNDGEEDRISAKGDFEREGREEDEKGEEPAKAPQNEDPNKARPTKGIAEPGTHDFIVKGPPRLLNEHRGNALFRALAEAQKTRFLASKQEGRTRVAAELIREWQSRDPPGRFLAYGYMNHSYHEVGEWRARTEVRRMLCEMVRRDREGGSSGRPAKDTTEPGMNDFLVSQGYVRGAALDKHPGNAAFRTLIEARRPGYLAYTPEGKKREVAKIVVSWRSRRPPGRFLSYNRGSGSWRDVGDGQALAMVRHMLGGGNGKAQGDEPTIEPRTTKDITEPGIHDFLFLRWGRLKESHQGNVLFCALAEAQRARYLVFSPAGKELEVAEIVRKWRSRRPPGRFLSYDPGSGMWRDVGDERAREKVHQMLTEPPSVHVPAPRPDQDNPEGKEGSEGEALKVALAMARKALTVEIPPEDGETGRGGSDEGAKGDEPEKALTDEPKRDMSYINWVKDRRGDAREPANPPGANDFVFAHGSQSGVHPGNTTFRALLAALRPAWAASNQAGKPRLVAEIVRDWRRQSPPGRFLKFDARRSWYDVGDKAAGAKVRRMLRDMSARDPADKDQKLVQGDAFGTDGVVRLEREPCTRRRGTPREGTEGVPMVLDDRPESERGERGERQREGGELETTEYVDPSHEEAMYLSLENLHRSFQRSGAVTPEDVEHMSRVMKLQMSMIDRQRKRIAKKDRGVVELNNLHNEMMAEKDEEIFRMKNTISYFMKGKTMNANQEEAQQNAAGQLQNVNMMNIQMNMIDRQRQCIEQKDREILEMERLLATTIEEKDREIQRLREEVARAEAEGEGAESEDEDVVALEVVSSDPPAAAAATGSDARGEGADSQSEGEGVYA